MQSLSLLTVFMGLLAVAMMTFLFHTDPFPVIPPSNSPTPFRTPRRTASVISSLFKNASDALEMIHFLGSSSDLQRLVRSHERVMLMCTVTWSGHDTAIAPHFLKAARQMRAERVQVPFAVFDCTNTEDRLCFHLNWRSFPMFFLFRDYGKRFQRWTSDAHYHLRRDNARMIKQLVLSDPYHRVHNVHHIRQLCMKYATIVLGIFPALSADEARAFTSAAEALFPHLFTNGTNTDALTFAISTSRSLASSLVGSESRQGLFILSRATGSIVTKLPDKLLDPIMRRNWRKIDNIVQLFEAQEQSHVHNQNKLDTDLVQSERTRISNFLACDCVLKSHVINPYQVSYHLIHLQSWIIEHIFRWPLVTQLQDWDKLNVNHPVALRGLPAIFFRLPTDTGLTASELLRVFLEEAARFRHKLLFAIVHDSPETAIRTLDFGSNMVFETVIDNLSQETFTMALRNICEAVFNGTLSNGTLWPPSSFPGFNSAASLENVESLSSTIKRVTLEELQSMVDDPLRRQTIVAFFCLYDEVGLRKFLQVSEEIAAAQTVNSSLIFVWVAVPWRDTDVELAQIDLFLDSPVAPYKFPALVKYSASVLPASKMFEGHHSLRAIKRFIELEDH